MVYNKHLCPSAEDAFNARRWGGFLKEFCDSMFEIEKTAGFLTVSGRPTVLVVAVIPTFNSLGVHSVITRIRCIDRRK